MEVSKHLGNLVSMPLTDFQVLDGFRSGVQSMDDFIHGDFRLSVENHYCQAYVVMLGVEVVALFAWSFDSIDLDLDDKWELQSGYSSLGTPDVSCEYQDTFYSKPRYPAIDIAYLAVQERWRGKRIGDFLIKSIADLARTQTLAGCQFLTVEALATSEYSAVGFYDRCGFMPSELRKPYKDTLRMYMPLYTKCETLDEECDEDL